MYHFDWIQRHAERTPNKLAVIDDRTGKQFTYREFNQRAIKLAHFFLHELKLKRGERIAILAKNSSQYFEVLFAVSKIGAVLNTLNWRLTVPELEFILNDCTPPVLLYEPEFAEQVKALKDLVPSITQLVVMGEMDDMANWEYETALVGQSDAPIEIPPLHYNDTWAILYTSGTTGRPKGAQVTYGNFFFNAIGAAQSLDITSQDTTLVALPTFHAGGLGLYAGPVFHAGGTVVVMRDFTPETLLQLIQDHKVSVILLVPSIYLIVDQFPEMDRFDLSSMRFWTSGGSALPPSLVEKYAERNIIIRQGFGMTETGPTVFMMPEEDALRKAGSVGKPVMHSYVCIMDQDQNVLGANQVGELCIRGNITTGYWKRPEATESAIIDGWLHSGDAAKFDDEGFFYIVDRWKDMFISGGENVYPAEIETVLYQLPQVAEAAVIGIPDPKWQEVGRAVIVLKEGQTLTEQAVIEFCQGKLAKYKIPKSIIFTASIPHNATGKVLKKELREKFGAP